jgi:hypothetical protein
MKDETDHRKIIADVYRTLSRGESPTSVEARPAVRGLQYLKGFSKTEADVWAFFANCNEWFCDMRTMFATRGDEEVLSAVAMEFREYMKAKLDETIPEEGHPWRPYRYPEDKEIDGLKLYDSTQPIYLTPAEVEWKEEHPDHVFRKRGGPSREQRADERRAMKHDLGYRVFRFFQRWAKKSPKLDTPRVFLGYFERRLKHEIACQRDPELRRELLRRAEKIINRALQKKISK